MGSELMRKGRSGMGLAGTHLGQSSAILTKYARPSTQSCALKSISENVSRLAHLPAGTSRQRSLQSLTVQKSGLTPR
jgi:hypothetical protein